MTKGKPWTIEEEAALKELVDANTSLDAICVKLGRKPDAVYVKMSSPWNYGKNLQ